METNAARREGPNVAAGIGRAAAPWAAPAARPILSVAGVSKRFAAIAAVDDLSFDVYPGEMFALLGPSGCGKTTLLRLIAGFETPDRGRILLDGHDLAGVPPHRRPVNTMFQSYALFPHLTVAGNVAFGLEQERMPKPEIAARVAEMLALVRLEGFERRKPHQLSGGQRQRVALARALAKRPLLLLLDEPLGALDRKLREETQFELLELQARLGTTFVVVTHDQDEAMVLAHRVAVMDAGRFAQVGPPAEIYEQPRNRWVADFVGDINLLDGCIAATTPQGVSITGPGGTIVAPAPAGAVADGTPVCLALRPEKITIDLAPPAAANVFAGQVVEVGYLGDHSVYKVRLDDGTVLKAANANRTRRIDDPVASGVRVWLSWPREAGVVLTE